MARQYLVYILKKVSFYIILLLSSINSFGQKEIPEITAISEMFVENIISGNMLQNLDFMVTDSNTGKDSAIASFEGMRYRIMNEFGKDVKVAPLGYNQAVLLMGSARVRDHFDGLKYSYVQIEDKNRFSVFQLSFAGNKIVDFGMLNEIYAKPDTQKMWFIGIPIYFWYCLSIFL